jgi:hypothetical protein
MIMPFVSEEMAKELARDMKDIVVESDGRMIIYHSDEHNLLEKGEKVLAYPKCNCKYCKARKK